MDKENYFYLKAEYEADLLRLQEQVKNQVEKEFEQRKLSEDKKMHQQNAASLSPAFSYNRSNAVEKTNQNIVLQEDLMQKERQKREKELLEEGTKAMQSSYFEQYGGSLSSAEKIVFAKESNTQTTSAEFNNASQFKGIEK